MSSIYRDDRSPYFTACFTAITNGRGTQCKRSTATANRKLARRIADELEEAGMGQRTPEQVLNYLDTVANLKARAAAKKAFDWTLRQTSGSGLASRTAKGFFESWLEGQAGGMTLEEFRDNGAKALRNWHGTVAPRSWQRYEQTIRLFLKSLGKRENDDLANIRRQDIVRFRDQQAKRVSPATVNMLLKVLRIAFRAAETDGAVPRSEAAFVKTLKVANDSFKRRPFKLKELEKLLAVCDDEWKSLVRFGLYTGARLGDLASMTWQNVDLQKSELAFVTRKTGRSVICPINKHLRTQIERLPAGDDPKQPLHPRAFEVLRRNGSVSMLSRQFSEIMADAGLASVKTHQVEDEKKRKGRDSRRELSEISFHALRHTAVSLLKVAGVGSAIAQDIVGHESAEISRHYTHVDDATKLEALNKLPVIGVEASKTRKK